MSSSQQLLGTLLKKIDQVEHLGWTYRPSGKGFFVTAPNGQHCTIGASRDNRGMKNAESALNALGLEGDLAKVRGDQEQQRQQAIAVDAKKAAARVPVVTFQTADTVQSNGHGPTDAAAAIDSSMEAATSRYAFVEETITPEFAEQLLARPRPRLANGQELRQRGLKEGHALKLAGIIERGEWICTPQGLIIAKDGGVLDGQHRLTAIALAGKPVQMMVAYGADPEIFQVLDTGIVRTYADVARTRGRQNTFHLSSAAKLGWNYDNWWNAVKAGGNGVTWPNWSKMTPSHVQLDATVDEWPQLETQVRGGTNMVGKNKGIIAAAIVFRALILRQIDAIWPEENPQHETNRRAALELFEMFCTSVSTGEMIGSGHPAYTVREWLRSGAKGGGVYAKMRREIQLIVLLKAWRRFCRTIKMEAARVQSFEVMPRPFLPKDPVEALRNVKVRNAAEGGWIRATVRDPDDEGGE